MSPRVATPRRRRVLRKLANGQTITRRDLDRQALLDQIDMIANVFGPSPTATSTDESRG